MKDLSELSPTLTSSEIRMGMRRLAPVSLELAKRAVALLLVWLMIPLGIADLPASGQEIPPPPPDQSAPQEQGPPPGADQGAPPQQYNPLSPEQLNQLVAPIALYPDALVAQILAAATYPTQVVDADRFVRANQGVPPDQMAQMANSQPWDPSVKALAAFPSVLANMDQNLDWTTQLGNAYYNQPQDVMNAVQAMRQQAYQAGQLQSTPQQAVTYEPDDVVIEPANPAVVYVPYYNPWVIWGFRPWYAWYAPPPPPGLVFGTGLAFGFGVGMVVGPWSRWGWGWGRWGCAWGPRPFVAYNHTTYVSRSVTVVNHGYYGRFDRSPAARAWNMRAAAHARAVAYNRGYNAGARAGYNRSAVTGYNRGYNRGAVNGNRTPYANNRSAMNTYNRGMQSRPAQNSNRTRNYSRPAQHYNRTAGGGGGHPSGGGGHPGGGGGGGHAGGGGHGHGR